MKNPTLLLLACGLSLSAAHAQTGAQPAPAAASAPASLAPAAPTVASQTWETDPTRVPEYLRVLAGSEPRTAGPFAKLLRVTLTRGALPPATKTLMGLAIARTLKNDYAARHLERLLKTTPEGRAKLAHFNAAGSDESKLGQDALPVGYALRLTRDIRGVDEAYFRRVGSAFNDAQVVEMTQTVCTMNYFVRLCAGLNLRPEAWLASTQPKPLPPAPSTDFGKVRVTLSTDEEMLWAAKLVAPESGDPWGLGVRIFNSQRAMLRSPEIGAAWMDYWQSVRAEAQVPRSTLLQVSYAVSMVNGCRYCVVHQVVGLKRVGVDVAKLVAMKKDDATLSPPELAAVTFARKLSQNPPQVTQQDLAALQAAFPGGTATEIILQTCAFSYMNRFTDGLRLPSEDEAVHIYREVYGPQPPLPPRTVEASHLEATGASAKAE